MLVWKGHTGKVRSLAFAPHAPRLVTTAGNSKFVWLWDAPTGKLLRKLVGPNIPVRTAAFFPDGHHVLGVHEHRRASVWDADTGARVAELETANWLFPDALAISPKGGLLLFSGQQLAEWDEPTRPATAPHRCDRTRPMPAGFYLPFQMGYSPAGTYFWGVSVSLVLLDPATLALRHQFYDELGANATTAGFTPDETKVGVAFGHRAAVWRLDDPKAPPVKLRGHGAQVRTVGFLPGGETVLTAAMDGTVRLWDVATGAEKRSFEWGIGKLRVAAVSPDGTLCAAGSAAGQLVVWDVDE